VWAGINQTFNGLVLNPHLYQPRFEVTRFGFCGGHRRDSLLIVVLREAR
jgi:hypothetical protein